MRRHCPQLCVWEAACFRAPQSLVLASEVLFHELDVPFSLTSRAGGAELAAGRLKRSAAAVQAVLGAGAVFFWGGCGFPRGSC